LNISGTISASALKFLPETDVLEEVLVLQERNPRGRIGEFIQGQIWGKNFSFFQYLENDNTPKFCIQVDVHFESKKQATILLPVTSPFADRFSKFFTGRFSAKFVIKLSLNITLRLKCVAALPCETLMSENERQCKTLKQRSTINTNKKRNAAN